MLDKLEEFGFYLMGCSLVGAYFKLKGKSFILGFLLSVFFTPVLVLIGSFLLDSARESL